MDCAEPTTRLRLKPRGEERAATPETRQACDTEAGGQTRSAARPPFVSGFWRRSFVVGPAVSAFPNLVNSKLWNAHQCAINAPDGAVYI